MPELHWKNKHSGSILSNACVACKIHCIAMCDYQESETTGQMDGQTDAGQSDPYVSLCFAGDTIKFAQVFLSNFSAFSKVFTIVWFFYKKLFGQTMKIHHSTFQSLVW